MNMITIKMTIMAVALTTVMMTSADNDVVIAFLSRSDGNLVKGFVSGHSRNSEDFSYKTGCKRIY